MPTFTVLIGSAGRATLTQSLDSLARQTRVDGDQVIVAFDAFEHDGAWVTEQAARVSAYGPGFHSCAYDAGYHWYGIEQINHAMRTVGMSGSHVLTIGDDDVYVDGAFAALRRRCQGHSTRPILFRFVSPWRELLWETPQMRVSRISGCCIAAPMAYVDAFPIKRYVEHDFDWMQGVLARCPQTPPDWWDRVLVIARPEVRGADVTHLGILQCWHCKDWRYLEDVKLLQPKCPKCAVVLDFPHRDVVGLGAHA